MQLLSRVLSLSYFILIKNLGWEIFQGIFIDQNNFEREFFYNIFLF